MLLVRMEYYLDDKKYRRVEDLPVDIQNNTTSCATTTRELMGTAAG